MDYFLSDVNLEVKNLAREIAENEIRPVRAKFDEEEHFPWEIVAKLREAGLFGIYIPAEYGGMTEGTDKGITNLVLATEEMSKVCGGISLCLAATALGTLPILVGATPEQKKKYLPKIASGEHLAAFGLTEPDAGSDAGAMKTNAVKKGAKYVLNGTKQFITNAGEAEIYTVMAVTDKARGSRGVSCFIVEKGTPGFTFGPHEKKMGIRASATRQLIFDNCEIPAENIVGGKEGMGFIHALETLNYSRPGVASQALGIAQGAINEIIPYAHERKQFGQSITSFQAIQHMLANMQSQVEAVRALLYSTSKWIDSGAKKFSKESAMCKLLASEAAMSVTTDAVQIAGGYGYTREYPFEKFMRDAKITQLYEGTSQIQRNEIAAGIIRDVVAGKNND